MPIRIEFDKLPRYNPGEKVTGYVILECPKPMKANFLGVYVSGAANTKLQRFEEKMSMSMHLVPKVKNTEKTYYASDSQLNAHGTLWEKTTENNGFIKSGTYPFSFTLPSSLLPSFKGSHGDISYHLSCKLDVEGFMTANLKANREFFVNPVVGLNTSRLKNKEGGIYKIERNTGMIFKNGMVIVRFALRKTGFLAGEKIVIPVEVDNQSKRSVYIVRARLRQKQSFTTENHIEISDYYLKSAIVKKKCSIAPGTKEVVTVEMTIPSVLPTLESRLINMHYFLHVGVQSTSTFNGNFEASTHIFIGTVPFRN